jgi:hypothetical protein
VRSVIEKALNVKESLIKTESVNPNKAFDDVIESLKNDKTYNDITVL